MKKNRRKQSRKSLRFSPYAWAKLLYLRDAGDTEIGGFGISAPHDLLLVEDIRLVQQECTVVSAEFGDDSVADFFDQQVDEGRHPEQFFRLFLHTHPGNSPTPSCTDEETFSRVFGRVDWAVMFILARHGPTYARLRYNLGPGVDTRLAVKVDYDRPFRGSEHELWEAEYLANLRVPQEHGSSFFGRDTSSINGKPREEEQIDDWWRDAWGEYADFGHHEREVHFGDMY